MGPSLLLFLCRRRGGGAGPLGGRCANGATCQNVCSPGSRPSTAGGTAVWSAHNASDARLSQPILVPLCCRGRGKRGRGHHGRRRQTTCPSSQAADEKLRQQRLVQLGPGEVAVATARRAALLRLLCGGCRGQGEGPLAKVKVPWPRHPPAEPEQAARRAVETAASPLWNCLRRPSTTSWTLRACSCARCGRAARQHARMGGSSGAGPCRSVCVLQSPRVVGP